MTTNTSAVLAIVAALAACGGHPSPHGPAHTCTTFETEFQTSSFDQIDLLLVIDNSHSMGDKAALLAAAVPNLLNRLVNYDCVDPMGAVVGVSSAGVCKKGWLGPLHTRDIHVAILDSSLGAAGGALCGLDGVGARQNDRAELLNRVGSGEHSVGDAEPSHFLAWFPSIPQSLSQPPPAVSVLTDATRLVGEVANMAAGVHTTGCAFEAPLEAMYRFLMQPDPYDHVEIAGDRASLVGVDATLLRQRHDFLRPGSILDIVIVTDENDASVDPLAFDGRAWQFASARFPGSPLGTAPRATRECDANPNDAACTSCALLMGDPAFGARCPRGAFLDPSEDGPALRFFHMKQRFGVDALFPVSRYVRGLLAPAVPDRAHEHDTTGAYSDNAASANCVNPIYAQDLPTDPGADLCHPVRGSRLPELVRFSVVGGVPHQLLQAQSGIDPDCPAGTAQADCPQKTRPTEDDWRRMIGKDPEHYDFAGIDPHMLESSEPRAGLPPPGAPDDADPLVGREWTTHAAALELACTFPLTTPKQDCTQSESGPGCDCGTGGDMPVCDPQSGAQVRGKAFPSIRELEVAHAAVGTFDPIATVSSICPVHLAETAPGDPLFAFQPIFPNLIDHLLSDYGALCIPLPLHRDANGGVSCLLVATLPRPGNQSMCAAYGLDVPDAAVLRQLRTQQRAEWRKSGGADAGVRNPLELPVCIVPQLVGADLDAQGWCGNSAKVGWCVGPSMGYCPQELVFSSPASPQGNLNFVHFSVVCSEGC